MKKQAYMNPVLQVVLMQQQTLLAASIKNVASGDTGITYGGGNNSSARVKQIDYSVWSDDWNEGQE